LEIDVAADRMGVSLMRDSLPPIDIETRPPLSEVAAPEAADTGKTTSAAAKRRQKAKAKKAAAKGASVPRLSASTVVRTIGMGRLVIEDDMAVVYHNTRNTRTYQEVPSQFVSFPSEDAEVLEWILRSRNLPFLVSSIPAETLEDRLEVANALMHAGMLVVVPNKDLESALSSKADAVPAYEPSDGEQESDDQDADDDDDDDDDDE
jgi:hypothetical protein